MKNSSNSILVCIFCYNVELFINNVFNKLKKYYHLDKQILFINDCSDDHTLKKILKIKKLNKKVKIKIINNKINSGYGANYKIAIKYALNNKYKKLLFLHGDDQYPVAKINNLIQNLETSDLVFGSRMSNKKSALKNMPKLKFYVNKILTYFINFIYKKNYSEYFSGFRGFDVNKLKILNLNKLSDKYIIEQQIHFLFIKFKFKISEFPIRTVYENQISRIPPISYTLQVLFYAIYFYFLELKKLKKYLSPFSRDILG